MTDITPLLTSLIGVFALALVVRFLIRDRDQLAFASILVAIVSIVVQGLLLPGVLSRLGMGAAG